MIADIKPSHLIYAWWNAERQSLNFSEITDAGYPECIHRFNYHLNVFGKTATVTVFFDDYDIDDGDLKKTAIDYMKGQYKRYDFDLDLCQVKLSDGIDKTTPAH